jgi:hypothetical protein
MTPRWKPEDSQGPCARWFCDLATEALTDGDAELSESYLDAWSRAEARVVAASKAAGGTLPRDPVERTAEIALEITRDPSSVRMRRRVS